MVESLKQQSLTKGEKMQSLKKFKNPKGLRNCRKFKKYLDNIGWGEWLYEKWDSRKSIGILENGEFLKKLKEIGKYLGKSQGIQIIKKCWHWELFVTVPMITNNESKIWQWLVNLSTTKKGEWEGEKDGERECERERDVF